MNFSGRQTDEFHPDRTWGELAVPELGKDICCRHLQRRLQEGFSHLGLLRMSHTGAAQFLWGWASELPGMLHC